MKIYPFSSFKDYENDIKQYSKFRKNYVFYSSKNKIFIIPDLESSVVRSEDFNILSFNKLNGNILQMGNINLEKPFIDCAKIKTLSDVQYQVTNANSRELIQFGVDKLEKFCLCKSTNISPNFSLQKIINYKNYKIYIGKNYTSNVVTEVFINK